MKELEFVSGSGYSCAPVEADYEVNFDHDGERQIIEFGDLRDAKMFFESLNIPKALWHVNGFPKLIEHYEYTEKIKQ